MSCLQKDKRVIKCDRGGNAMSSNTMDSPQKMDLFSGVSSDAKTDEDAMPPLKEQASDQDLLDYMVLVLARNMTCEAAFKGGYMLNKILGEHSRRTRDIDFSIARKKDYEEIKMILRSIGEKFVQSGYISRYEIKEDIAERCSGGIEMYNESTGLKIGVDVGLHNISYGLQDYDLGFATVHGFTAERMLADKLIAISTRKRFRRVKDIYDFYAITNFFDVDLQLLKEFTELRGGAEWEHIPFKEDVIEQYEYAWEKLELRNPIVSAKLEKPLFADVLDRYYTIAIAIKENLDVTKWNHKNKQLQ